MRTGGVLARELSEAGNKDNRPGMIKRMEDAGKRWSKEA